MELDLGVERRNLVAVQMERAPYLHAEVCFRQHDRLVIGIDPACQLARSARTAFLIQSDIDVHGFTDDGVLADGRYRITGVRQGMDDDTIELRRLKE